MPATTTFSDVAKQSAYGNSLIVQRYHGGLATTLVNTFTVANAASTAGDTIYLCPIPWQARIVDISFVLDDIAAQTAGSGVTPVGSIFVRSMKDKTAKTATDLASLEYTKILATAGDYAKAAAAAGGTTKSLAGWTISATNEYPLFTGVNIAPLDSVANVEYHANLPFAARLCTCSEACAFQTSVSVGSETKTTYVFGENALGIADKEHYGMLTWVCTTPITKGTGGKDTANVMCKVTYVEPSPSGIVTGKIASNS